MFINLLIYISDRIDHVSMARSLFFFNLSMVETQCLHQFQKFNCFIYLFIYITSRKGLVDLPRKTQYYFNHQHLLKYISQVTKGERKGKNDSRQPTLGEISVSTKLDSELYCSPSKVNADLMQIALNSNIVKPH